MTYIRNHNSSAGLQTASLPQALGQGHAYGASIPDMPAPASELDSEVCALGASIDALDIKIRQLGDRLMPVLADEPQTGNSSGPDEMTPRSPFARRLRELRLQVERTAAFAENRLHRDLAC